MADASRRAGTGSTRRAFLAAVGAAAGGLAGCTRGQVQGGLSGSIDVSGSSTVYPVTTAMQELFVEDHPDVDISVSRDGTSAGFENAFVPGRSDINDASRPITEEEAEQCRANGFEPLEFLVARDALTVVVNNDNDWVDCIDVATLGEIWGPDDPPETWADVDPDWPDEPFDLYGPETTSGTFDYFTEHVVGEAGQIRSDFEGTEEDDLIARGVRDDTHAMGYLPFAYYTNNPDETKALALDESGGQGGDGGGDGDGEDGGGNDGQGDGEGGAGDCVAPSLENAKSGAYSLARPLFIYVNSERVREHEHLAAFVEFYLKNTDRDDLLAEQIGYVPMSESEVEENLATLAEYTDR